MNKAHRKPIPARWYTGMEVMIVVEAKVPHARIKEFQAGYASMRGKPRPLGWRQSLLLQDTEDPELHRLSTTWESQDALDKYRRSTNVPVVIALFRSVGVEPKIHVFQIQERLALAD
ncbi:hypothetical protein E6H36_01420 [Candidatus Bathyarchaeota archaeon]|nr:MAG: hypothetical protein E6H36_01420 [Candidatus Bathyarchaeota archaeon]TMI31913.1 MAG: hypothetical protein E6H29_04165 [Candidatus Bathyarchaeota archaeon]